MLLVRLLEANVSMKRIEEFLADEEIDTGFIEDSDDHSFEHSVLIENGNFYWEKANNAIDESKMILSKVNLSIKKGQFIAIIGRYAYIDIYRRIDSVSFKMRASLSNHFSNNL